MRRNCSGSRAENGLLLPPLFINGLGYARGDITTNSVESSFAIFKRSLYDTFHQVSEAHLQRYATEADFKWNHRIKLGFDDTARTVEVLKGISGKRLTYRRTGEAQAR